MIIIGVDPGLSGAIAAIEYPLQQLHVFDIPTFEITKNKKRRNVIDEPALENMIRFLGSLNPRLVIIEQVGGMTGQSASASFNFGDTFGLTRTLFRCYTTCEVLRPPPQKWKKMFSLGSEKGDSVNKADQIFPGYSSIWRGPRGALKHDRAEAALLAHYGRKLLESGEHVDQHPLHTPSLVREMRTDH